MERVTENTLFKVRNALLRVGLTEQQITDAINEMQNEGILFRERAAEKLVVEFRNEDEEFAKKVREELIKLGKQRHPHPY